MYAPGMPAPLMGLLLVGCSIVLTAECNLEALKRPILPHIRQFRVFRLMARVKAGVIAPCVEPTHSAKKCQNPTFKPRLKAPPAVTNGQRGRVCPIHTESMG